MLRYPTATELSGRCDSVDHGMAHRRFITDVPGSAVRLSTRLTMTMQVADDGHDLDRLAIGVLLVPVCLGAVSGAGVGRLRDDPVGGAV